MNELSEPLRKTPLARTLEEAAPGSMVLVDGRGEVISLGRARMLNALSVAGHLAYGAFFIGCCGALFGKVGGAMASSYLVFVAWNMYAGLRASRASRLVSSQPDRAEAVLLPLTRGPWRAASVRGHAHTLLARVAIERGDHAGALAQFRAAVAAYSREDSRDPYAQLARHGEILTLVNLGQTREARGALGRLGPVPRGKYLRFQRWACELYVCFAEGLQSLTPDELHERSRAALHLSSGAALIALCSWAHTQIGDHDQAAHLLAEARSRAEGSELAKLCPKLHAWMEACPSPDSALE